MTWIFTLSFLLIPLCIKGHFEEFLYPVATIIHEDQEKFCIIHQNGEHLELWLWEPESQYATKALLSAFTPAGLTVLPNKKAFSFIDHDRVRIKYVDKRSPKSIDLYGPYDLTTLSWINNTEFYFAAKERHHSNLFHATIDGDLFRLTVSNHNDYFYPQKINDLFFFVEKSPETGCSIKTTLYPTQALQAQEKKYRNIDLKAHMTQIMQEVETAYQPFLALEHAEIVVSFEQKTTIAFLTMTSETSGFFLQHPTHIHNKDDTILFSYHALTKEAGQWHSHELFTFTLPLHLLVPQKGKTRLYESILPLLPHYDQEQGKIYFVDHTLKNDCLNVFCYNLSDGSLEQKTQTHLFGQNYFTPRLINDSLFCGGTVIHGHRTPQDPTIDIDTSGIQYFCLNKLIR